MTNQNSPKLLTDRTPQQADTPSTPTDIFRTGTLPPLPSENEDENTAQTGEEQATTMSIRDRIAEAEEWGENTMLNRTSTRNPLDKYTNHKMKEVHLISPMAALRYIDLEIVGSWENIKTGKLLAQPFGAYANKAENHND
ncbi:hypothetical protein BGY98DRAFT_1094321 [Russula aff. rugulosa BPL654]|nr:hypothetical protein BGY98DRAFT_1094321 [Russula aff. rugulosa BPL654]